MDPVKPEVTIRSAGHEDIQSIIEIGATTFTETFGYSLPPHDLEAYVNTIYIPTTVQLDLDDPHSGIFVAVVNAKVTGFMESSETRRILVFPRTWRP